MYKYFVAIEPPEPTRSLVANIMVQLGDAAPVPHITVKAPGGLAPDLAWLPEVQDVARRCPVFKVALGQPGTFGVHVLYLAVRSREIHHLHDQLERRVALLSSETGQSVEGGEYVPHLTLGRFDTGEEDRLRTAQSLVGGLVPFEPFVAHEIVVFRRDGDGPYSAWRRLRLGRDA